MNLNMYGIYPIEARLLSVAATASILNVFGNTSFRRSETIAKSGFQTTGC